MTKQNHDQEYLKLVRRVLDEGIEKKDRTGTGTLSVFGHQMRFDLSNGSIPLLTTKKMHTRSIIHELLWFISGSTNIKYLQDNGVRIWNEWASDEGDIGPGYGHQWRNCDGIDQLGLVLSDIKNNPNSRRLLVDSWNVKDIDKITLPPCHYSFQFYVADGKLSLLLNMRSNDLFLGNPFNIAQYSILLHMVAQVTDLKPGEFIYSGGDCHIYLNHIDQCKEQLTRKPYTSPTLKLNTNIKEIDDFTYEDFEIVDYEHHPTIKGEVSV